MTAIKRCSKCKIDKYDYDFYRHNRDGLRSTCKKCELELGREFRKTHPDKRKRVRDRTKYRNLAEERPKYAARLTLNVAVRLGKVQKPKTCEINDETCKGRLEGHHFDYSKPLEVVWICKKHHMEKHLTS